MGGGQQVSAVKGGTLQDSMALSQQQETQESARTLALSAYVYLYI